MQCDYKSVWADYAYNNDNRFATNRELKQLFSEGDFSAPTAAESGIPLLSDGRRFVVNNETLHTLIFGESGCKKTRSAVLPALASMVRAGESIFVTDVKGEISGNAKLRELLELNDYKTVFLDFRSFCADGFNLLHYAFQTYRHGGKEEGLAEAAQLVAGLRSGYADSKDPYWDNSAESVLNAVIEILFDVGASNPGLDSAVNLATVASFMTGTALDKLGDLFDKDYRTSASGAILALRSVGDLPDSTRGCVASTAAAMLKDFTRQPSLTKMLSASTFTVDRMYEEPTCVFLIVPDETTACDHIAGLMLDTFYGRLIKIFGERYQNAGSAPRRINFMADEFCNVRISDMAGKISASRSRSMRWFLICQSKAQLERAYPHEWPAIVGNCKNVLFLQSSDPSMLEYISALCGRTYVTEALGGEPLVSAERLRCLRQTRDDKEAIYIRGELKYRALLLDFDRYAIAGVSGSKRYALPERMKNARFMRYTPDRLLDDLNLSNIKPLFSARKRSA